MKVKLNCLDYEFTIDFPSRINIGDNIILDNFIDEDYLLKNRWLNKKTQEILKYIEDNDYVCEDIYWVKVEGEIVQSVYLVKN
jgi:hypothetical protein